MSDFSSLLAQAAWKGSLILAVGCAAAWLPSRAPAGPSGGEPARARPDSLGNRTSGDCTPHGIARLEPGTPSHRAVARADPCAAARPAGAGGRAGGMLSLLVPSPGLDCASATAPR